MSEEQIYSKEEIDRVYAENERLKAVLMTESEKRDLLSKEHYRTRIAELEEDNERLKGKVDAMLRANSEISKCLLLTEARIELLEGVVERLRQALHSAYRKMQMPAGERQEKVAMILNAKLKNK